MDKSANLDISTNTTIVQTKNDCCGLAVLHSNINKAPILPHTKEK